MIKITELKHAWKNYRIPKNLPGSERMKYRLSEAMKECMKYAPVEKSQ